MPNRCLNRVATNPAAAHTTMMIQFRPTGRKSSPSRIRTSRTPTDIPPRTLKAVSPVRLQNLKRPQRDPSTKQPRVASVSTRSDSPSAFATFTVATHTATNVSHIDSMAEDFQTTDHKTQGPARSPTLSLFSTASLPPPSRTIRLRVRTIATVPSERQNQTLLHQRQILNLPRSDSCHPQRYLRGHPFQGIELARE